MVLAKNHHYGEDLALVARCLKGEEAAANQLLAQHQYVLKAMLIRRGADESVADEFLQDLWGDCLGIGPGASGLLVKYSGKSALRTWLAKVVTNRWLDRVRSHREVEDDGSTRTDHCVFDTDPQPPEAALAKLLRPALQQAFEQCDAEAFVLLQLVHIQGISQRDVAASWRMSESRLCRCLAKAMRQIRADTLKYIRDKDPYLRLGWEDLAEFCADVARGPSSGLAKNGE